MSLPLDLQEEDLRKPFSYRLAWIYGFAGIALPVLGYLMFLSSYRGFNNFIPQIVWLPNSNTFIIPTIVLSFICPTIASILCIRKTSLNNIGLPRRKLFISGFLVFLIACVIGSAAFLVTLGDEVFIILAFFSVLYLGYFFLAAITAWISAWYFSRAI